MQPSHSFVSALGALGLVLGLATPALAEQPARSCPGPYMKYDAAGIRQVAVDLGFPDPDASVVATLAFDKNGDGNICAVNLGNKRDPIRFFVIDNIAR